MKPAFFCSLFKTFFKPQLKNAFSHRNFKGFQVFLLLMCMVKDSYKTIKSLSEAVYKDKGSRFLAFAYPVTTADEALQIVRNIKKQYHDARHHCFAYKLGISDDNYRVNDDGEPSGTAGKPILGQIVSHNLSDIIIVVVRYFGGVLLGTGGLIQAYKTASAEAIKNAQLIEKTVTSTIHLRFSYEILSTVMRKVKELDLQILEQNFAESCKLVVGVRLSQLSEIQNVLEGIYGLQLVDF